MKMLSEDILNCHFKNGLLMLPYYHYAIINKLSDIESAEIRYDILPVRKRVLNLIRGIKKIWPCRKKIIIFSSTLFNYKRSGGDYYNILHGYYYDLYKDDTLLIEDSNPDNEWRTTNSYPNLCFINTYFVTLSWVLASLANKIKPIHIPDYDIFIEKSPNRHSIRDLSRNDYYISCYSFFLRLLFRFVKPCVIFVNCASYGGDSAVICYVAKQMGIKVIEPQHGVVRKSPAYYYHTVAVDSSEYYNYLPDTLFTFGKYWNQFVRWNYEKVEVGYPDMEHFLTNFNLESQNPQYDLLVVSQPMAGDLETEKQALIKGICAFYPSNKILLRIHPSEKRDEQENVYKDCNNLVISHTSTILYEDMVNSRHILGWYSNCLYEALAFGKNPIIVDCPMTKELFPEDLGVRIESPSDLKSIIEENQISNIDKTYYWASDFENNVKGIVDKYLL